MREILKTMTNRTLFLSVALAGAAFTGVTWAHSTGADPGYTGAPGDQTCVACHLGTLQSGPGSLTIEFPNSTGWVAGQKYTIHIILADPTAKRWGFELTNRKEATQVFEGAFAVPAGSPARVLLEKLGSLGYATHTPSGTYQNQTTQAAWDVDWTAPAAGAGAIRFYAAGNAANNNGDLTGDKIYTANLSVPEAVSAGPTLTVGNTVFSQFVFGGGWYTAMYFTNTNSVATPVNVNFYSDAATPLSIGGQTSQTVNLAAGATQIVEARNTGSLTQGWATFDLPTGVVGYGVFRQSVAGQSDQEAVVPFANSTLTKTLVTFDNTAYVTAVALWFNGSVAGTVTMVAVDEQGHQVGTAVLNMMPGTKQAFVVTDKIAGVNGHRGSLTFTTSNGTVAALGLRFNGSAFPSIPASAVN